MIKVNLTLNRFSQTEYETDKSSVIYNDMGDLVIKDSPKKIIQRQYEKMNVSGKIIM